MIRLLFLVVLLVVTLGALAYLIASWLSTPRRRLLRQFDRMRRLILQGVEPEQRPHVDQLLEDSEEHLRGLIRAHKRMEVLSEMADAASELTDAQEPFDREEMEEAIERDVTYFLSEMARISSEVDYDWRQSVERLESFTDELEEQKRVFDRLEKLPEER